MVGDEVVGVVVVAVVAFDVLLQLEQVAPKTEVVSRPAQRLHFLNHVRC